LRSAAHLIVDIAALTFCSARGPTVLGRAGNTARGYGKTSLANALGLVAVVAATRDSWAFDAGSRVGG
jgi:hypothetical protein